MTELTIGVCDDLAEERFSLSHMIQAYAQARGLSVRLQLFASGKELLDACLSSHIFQIIFLDIYMPDMSGIETAQQLRQAGVEASIIFATTSMDHGVDSFSVRASDYLVKPFSEADVEQALDWCLDHLPKSLRSLSIYAEGEQYECPVSSIFYIEVLGHQCHIHLAQNRELVTYQGLDKLEAAIDDPDFLRCHRSVLVNMNYIQGVEQNDFRLSSGALVPISFSNLSRVRNQFIDWTYQKAWEKQ